MRVRIAVAVSDDRGTWSAVGYPDPHCDLAEDMATQACECLDEAPVSRIVWVEAEIPPPQVVEGEVEA